MIEVKIPSDGHMTRMLSLPETDLTIQLGIFSEALNIYQERGEARGEVWKRFGMQDSIHHLTSKAARLDAGRNQIGMRQFQEGDKVDCSDIRTVMIDEAMDAINYAAFTVRHIRGETSK